MRVGEVISQICNVTRFVCNNAFYGPKHYKRVWGNKENNNILKPRFHSVLW